tara:strand:+ start:908 stop:1438 length:531 start_codon:yes stop_codon:yes gene_type:complete
MASANIVHQLTEWISVKEFTNKDGMIIRYFGQPSGKAASTASVLRYARDENISIEAMLDLITVKAQTNTASKQKAKAVAQAFDHEAFIDKLESIPEEKQVIVLSRLNSQEIRAIDLALRGKKVTNRGPKGTPEKHLQSVINELDIPYFVNADGDIEEKEEIISHQDNYFHDMFMGV